MTPDDMADYHGEMNDWCEARADASEGFTAVAYTVCAKQHLHAYRYWYQQANPGRAKARENE